MRKIGLVFLLTVILMGGMVYADAQFNPPPSNESRSGKFHGPEKMIEKIAKDLGLTDEQKNKFLADANLVEKKAKALRESDKGIFDKVQAELSKDNPDMKKVAGYIQEMGKNDAEVHLMRIEQIVNLRKALTLEQKAKFDAIMKQKKNGKRPH